jgi:tetratricopeptide (TPR) repeat protein
MLSRLAILQYTRGFGRHQTGGFKGLSTQFSSRKQQENHQWQYSSHKTDSSNNNQRSNGRNNNDKRNRRTYFYYTGPLLSLSLLSTLKDSISPPKLDKDPLKDKIKQSWLARKHRKYDDAIQILHDALPAAQAHGDPLVYTRFLDELANTYHEKGDIENAEKCFRDVMQRLVRMHGKNDSSPEFIGISLKMADIYARKGELDNAETGFKHCVSRQLQVMEKHLKNFLISKGAGVEEMHLVEAHGPKYSDPVALFGMCLELFAHFLVEYRGEDRLKEAEEYIDEVLKISSHIYGSNSFHPLNVLNNFGALCVMKNRFELAKKYLKIGIDRIVHIDECSSLIVGYYCNYAEALFHTGEIEEALKYAQKAALLAKDDSSNIQKYAATFLQQMEKEARKQGKGSGGWFSWLI